MKGIVNEGHPIRIPNHQPPKPTLLAGGGFQHFLSSSLPGEMIQFDGRIFFKWVGSTTKKDITIKQYVNYEF